MNITDFMYGPQKDYSTYVLYSRAIPSMIDGLKPSQRKILWATNKYAKKFMKVASLTGMTMASANYHHGDASLNNAVNGMVQEFNNNKPLLIGQGSFGTRLVPHAAAARYTFAKIHDNFERYFKDGYILPKNNDPESPEPNFYLPIIPWILINGVEGVAIGFATKIKPYNIKDVKRLVKRCIDGKDISKEVMIPHYEGFRGTITRSEKIECYGVVENIKGFQFDITELPIGYDRESYIEILDDLQDNDTIVSYKDKCSKQGFHFSIKMKRSSVKGSLSEAFIIKTFKLKKILSENITVIDESGSLKVYEHPNDLIIDFVKFRLKVYDTRKQYLNQLFLDELDELNNILKFTNLVVDNQITLKKKTKKEIIGQSLSLGIKKKFIDVCLSRSIYKFTSDEITIIKNKIESKQNQLSELEIFVSSEEYKKEIGEI